ncbi:hypothetical protein EIP91_008382 [Steccherinum ochraceum]|uniref:MRH domain-containing protein n=1 Tax=Steccherinum ochraceum TaxID=92696 RepID=A0A4R0R2Y8_9APHY|nr:hypothetical protein EIP91_008382 [Steccherinum ochraceum]
MALMNLLVYAITPVKLSEKSTGVESHLNGSKIRSTYIAFAQKEKKRLEGELRTFEQEVVQRQVEVTRLRDLVERAESLSEASMQQKRQSPLFQSLLTHHRALKSLQKVYREHLEREKSLGDILDNLRTGYNPNYQDMAVLEAVRGWEHFAGLPHINDVQKDEAETESEETGETSQEDLETDQIEDDLWSESQLDHQLDELLAADYDTLLLEHEKHVESPDTQSACSYLPDFLLPQYEAARAALVSLLDVIGVLKSTSRADKSSDTSRARKTLSDAEHSLKLTQDEVEKAQTDLGRLFNPEWFGAEGEWKKLEGLCLTKDTGEYTYEVCLFGEAKQKPNHGGTAFSLGHFSGWSDASDAKPGSVEYHSKQRYTQGTKCWNGPARSVQLVLACGTENALHAVTELEKCEYQLTGTTPALCRPIEALAKEANGRLFVIDSYNIHRLVIAGVTVASKFFSDVFYTNSRYAKVGGLPQGELNQLELQFLLLNDFRLMIAMEEMQSYAEQLIRFSENNSDPLYSPLSRYPSSANQPSPAGPTKFMNFVDTMCQPASPSVHQFDSQTPQVGPTRPFRRSTSSCSGMSTSDAASEIETDVEGSTDDEPTIRPTHSSASSETMSLHSTASDSDSQYPDDGDRGWDERDAVSSDSSSMDHHMRSP